MEPEGAIKNVLHIYNTGKVFIGEVMSDDYVLLRTLLCHSHKSWKQKAEEMGETYILP